MTVRRLVAGFVVLVLLAALGVAAVVLRHDRHSLATTRAELGRRHAALGVARQRAASEHYRLGRATAKLNRATALAHRLQDRLGNPWGGHIPMNTDAAINGDVDRLIPHGTTPVAIRPIQPAGSQPAQLAVVWQARSAGGGFPNTGFMLWTAHDDLGSATGTYGAYRHWHLTYDWHFDSSPRVAIAGSPGHQRTHHDPDGRSFSFTVGDATGDGVPEVLVGFDSDGSGGCTQWQLLATSDGRSRPILRRRSICDGGVRIDQGRIAIKRAIGGKGCSIHGCGDFHRNLLQRTATGWVRVSRTVVGPPVPTA